MAQKIPHSMSFRVCVYPSEEKGYFTAHCLELDVIGEDKNVEGALNDLLEVIETQVESCQTHKAQFLFPAPGSIWQKYNSSRKAKRRISEELINRVIQNANKRLGHKMPAIDYIVGTKEVPQECLADH